MSDQKLLRQQRVIQVFGIMMLFSPFVNLYLSLYHIKNPYKWHWPVFKSLISDIGTVHWILWTCSIIIGLLMLKGKRESWISVLGLLALFIGYDVITLKTEMQRSGMLPLVLLGCNLVVFVVVYMAEFNKPISKKVADQLKKIADPNAALLTKAKIDPMITGPANNVQLNNEQSNETESEQATFDLVKLLNVTVEFENVGPWAKIIRVDGSNLIFQCYQEPPAEIESRTVEILVGHLGLILSFESKQKSVYTFKCHEVVYYRDLAVA